MTTASGIPAVESPLLVSVPPVGAPKRRRRRVREQAASLVRTLLDSYVGADPSLVSDLARLVGAEFSKPQRDLAALNARLAEHGVTVEADHPVLNRQGALGGCFGVRVVLNANVLHGMPEERLRVVLTHELAHLDQMRRAKASGTDVDDLYQRKLRAWNNGTNFSVDKYLTDPLEVQALARNAVDTAHEQGADVDRAMRSGSLTRYAPLQPRDRKRFLKNAYRMAAEH